MNLLSELRRRNPLLYWFGWFNFIVGLVCLAGIFTDDKQLLGVSRWLKPMKFYFSVGIMVWTMDWLLYYLNNARKVKSFSWFIVVTMFIENALILLQAFRSTTSHFNTKTTLDNMIFGLMGIFIVVFTITCIKICIAFFRQKKFDLPLAYVWGIRLGILFFLIFSLEGGMMLGLMKHTVGGADGEPGIPVFNWSTQYGDLRIAHFLGLHSLQLLPFLGYYLTKTKTQIVSISIIYFIAVMVLFIQAMQGLPLFA